MTPPPPDASVRLHLKCPDAEDFVERFAPNVTRGGIFLPTRDAREVGATIRFEIALFDDTVVFAGEGVVTWAKPKGIGVKFTTLDFATERMLERLLSRREAAPAAPEGPSAAPACPASAPSSASGPATAWESPAAELSRPTPPALQARPTPAAAAATGSSPLSTAAAATGSSPLSIELGTRRPLVRVAIVCSAVFAGVAVVWISIGRARLRPGAPARPAKSATVEIAARAAAAPALETATLPPPVPSSPAPEPPTEAPPAPPPPRAPTPPPASARSSGLRVEKMLTGASYKNFTCPNPTAQFSAKSSRTVNVCLQVTHKTGKADRLTLVWERNGSFSGKTPVELPTSKSTVRTRAHMKISKNRVGSWSVSVVSDRNAPLAQTTFDVVP
jgi:Tfp pilus assembly protein PilZ